MTVCARGVAGAVLVFAGDTQHAKITVRSSRSGITRAVSLVVARLGGIRVHRAVLTNVFDGTDFGGKLRRPAIAAVGITYRNLVSSGNTQHAGAAVRAGRSGIAFAVRVLITGRQ